jgi:hypothetical protein
MLKEILEKAGLTVEVKYAESPVAPGQLKHHYMPKIPLVIVKESFSWDHEKHKVELKLGRTFKNPKFWQQPAESIMASRELYQKMREFDQEGFDLIITFRNSQNQSEEWKGIWNRLQKAASSEIG